MYERSERKKKDPESLKAIFSSTLEQSIIPENISKIFLGINCAIFIEPNPEVPEQEFEIEYVYGYRTFDCRQNLRYNAKGQPVFMVAALGIILDQDSNTMKVFGGQETKMMAKNVADDSKYHMDDILSLDISTDRKTVVTGQVGRSPSIHVWDAETAESKCMFRLKEGSRGVAAISVSPCLRYVVSVDLHNDHHVIIHNIKKNKQLLHIEGSKDKIINVAWSKKPDDLRFCTVGLKELKFWNPADASKRLFSKGTFGTKAKMTTFSCAVFDVEGTAYTGGQNGMIYTWDQAGQLDRVVKGHGAEITAMIHEQGKLITGGKDNKLMIFNTSKGDITLEKTIDLDSSYPRAIDYMDGKVLVGLRNGMIFEYSEENETKKNLMAAHHEGEAWGLEVVPEKNLILTIGDDNKVMVYNYLERKFISKGTISKKDKPKNAEKAKKVTASTLSDYPPNKQGRAVAYCFHNGHVAISNNMGKVSIRHIDDLDRKIKTLKDADEWNEVMKYSPCGKYLAVGSHDNNVYIYDVNSNYSLYSKFSKHNSFVTSVDWSADSTYIRSVCGAYEKLYYKVDTKEFDSSGLSNTKSMVWASSSAKIGWDVEGIYPSGEDGSHINSVSVSADHSLIATADDFGLLNIYRYPCVSLKHKARSYSGHSEHVVRAVFTPDGQKIFTIGGYDKAVIQWRRK